MTMECEALRRFLIWVVMEAQAVQLSGSTVPRKALVDWREFALRVALESGLLSARW